MIPLTVCCDCQASVSALKQIMKTTEKWQTEYLGVYYLSSQTGANIKKNLILTFIVTRKVKEMVIER